MPLTTETRRGPDEILSACGAGGRCDGDVGLHMEFHYDGNRIITSRVRSIAIEQDASLPGPF